MPPCLSAGEHVDQLYEQKSSIFFIENLTSVEGFSGSIVSIKQIRELKRTEIDVINREANLRVAKYLIFRLTSRVGCLSLIGRRSKS